MGVAAVPIQSRDKGRFQEEHSKYDNSKPLNSKRNTANMIILNG